MSYGDAAIQVLSPMLFNIRYMAVHCEWSLREILMMRRVIRLGCSNSGTIVGNENLLQFLWFNDCLSYNNMKSKNAYYKCLVEHIGVIQMTKKIITDAVMDSYVLLQKKNNKNVCIAGGYPLARYQESYDKYDCPAHRDVDIFVPANKMITGVSSINQEIDTRNSIQQIELIVALFGNVSYRVIPDKSCYYNKGNLIYDDGMGITNQLMDYLHRKYRDINFDVKTILRLDNQLNHLVYGNVTDSHAHFPRLLMNVSKFHIPLFDVSIDVVALDCSRLKYMKLEEDEEKGCAFCWGKEVVRRFDFTAVSLFSNVKMPLLEGMDGLLPQFFVGTHHSQCIRDAREKIINLQTDFKKHFIDVVFPEKALWLLRPERLYKYLVVKKFEIGDDFLSTLA